MLVVMGVLIPPRRYDRLLAGELKSWRRRALDDEQEFGVRSLFLPPNQLDSYRNEGKGLIATDGGWTERTLEAPRLLYNRLVRPFPSESRGLRDLNGESRFLVFNETNRWNRRLVSTILRSDGEARKWVLPTRPYVPEANTMSEPGFYLLTPSYHAVGTHGYVAENRNGDLLRYQRLNGGLKGTVRLNRRYPDLHKIFPPQIQWLSRLPFLPAGPDGPAEWRFYAQRGSDFQWKLVAAVVKRDALRGEKPPRAWPLEEALALTYGDKGAAIGERLKHAALFLVQTLTLFLPGIAQCAIDFWVDQTGRGIMLDLSGHYRTDWLVRAGEGHMLKRLVSHPVQFARTLFLTGVVRLHVGIDQDRS